VRSFAARSTEEEMMDGETVTAADFAACLHDLAQVNTVTLARPPTLRFLAHATAQMRPGEAFSLLDVGYGEGDMLRAVHRWATRRGLRARLSGVDLNPRSEPAARAATDPAWGIDYRTGDVFDLNEADRPDFVISSLVTHHMTNPQVVRFLAWMEAVTRRGWMVNDLHRSALAFYGFKLLSTLAMWHPFVRHDGPVSVARAFRRADWERLIAEAGTTEAEVRWRFPFRYCVERIK
jgi:2-polyprenyl-3-methyl-5-hydroxy-6-metoxy-1,4-benzoquinol methylase